MALIENATAQTSTSENHPTSKTCSEKTLPQNQHTQRSTKTSIHKGLPRRLQSRTRQALQSAVASIFNLALKDVPNFIEMPDLMENIAF
jgi:hypothetical protein